MSKGNYLKLIIYMEFMLNPTLDDLNNILIMVKKKYLLNQYYAKNLCLLLSE